jgi:anti-sigma-K factor RskA
MTDIQHLREEEHEQIAELLAVDALDALDPAEREQLARLRAAHGLDCVDCAALEVEFADTAADLAFALPSRTPSPGAWDRLHAATQDTAVPQLATRRGLRTRILAAAAAVVLVGAGVGIGYGIHSGTSSDKSAVAAFLAQPGTRLATFGTPTDQSLAVLYQPGHSAAWVVGQDLPAPSKGRVYELWYQRSGETHMHSAGTFSGGSINKKTTLAGDFAALAVSVEPPGGSAQPTGKPLYLLPIHQ